MSVDRSRDAFSDEVKAEARRWLARWREVGPLLDDERWARLRASSDASLLQQSWDLLSMWDPNVPGDDGEAIRLQQRVFARLDRREAE